MIPQRGGVLIRRLYGWAEADGWLLEQEVAYNGHAFPACLSQIRQSGHVSCLVFSPSIADL